MAEWAPENVWSADSPKACLVLPTPSLMLLPGSQQPMLIDCLPGRWNILVPHVPWDQLDERIDFHSLGFILAHDAWRDDWLDPEKGAFGSQQLSIVKRRARVHCSNHVLGVADPSVTASDQFVLERDQLMARRLEVEALRVLAFDLVERTRRNRWRRAQCEREAYLDSSLRIAAFPINMGQSQDTTLTLYLQGALAVRIECRYELGTTRPTRTPFAQPVFSKEVLEWRERVGAHVYSDEHSCVTDLLDEASTPKELGQQTQGGIKRARNAGRF
jgi:hypothetical protein